MRACVRAVLACLRIYVATTLFQSGKAPLKIISFTRENGKLCVRGRFAGDNDGDEYYETVERDVMFSFSLSSFLCVCCSVLFCSACK